MKSEHEELSVHQAASPAPSAQARTNLNASERALSPWSIGGTCFAEPEEGSLRIIVGRVYGALDDVGRLGFIVQEYVAQTDEEGFELTSCEWADQCPLTDAHFLLNANAPHRWMRASRYLRGLIEQGQPITLEIERAALRG